MPEKRQFIITDARGGTAIPVRVVTQAERSEIVGREEGMLKVRLVASPAGSDAANQELIGLLAETLQVAGSKLAVVAGQNAREKIVSVEGLTTEEVESKLNVGE